MADSVVCIAIDFGTSYSGYCFKFFQGKQIRLPNWGSGHGLETPKTPTCILLDENGKFLKFGYEAVLHYTNIAKKKETRNMYFFNNFKMELYGKELNRELMISAADGKQMRAMKVFSESLKFMKDHALERVGKHITGKKYSASKVTWVLTVPAIWTPVAKQFMKEAAVEAGLVTELNSVKLIIALEPEAASVWCKQLPSEGFISGDLEQTFEVPKRKYMVVDCGGGTIDITVHEVMEGGLLKELHKASGNNMGGQTVDNNFKVFLREIFSVRVFDTFEETQPSEFQKFMYQFMVCKRSKNADDVAIQCPYSLYTLASKEKEIEDYFNGVMGAEWESGSIILSVERMRSFHEDSFRGIEKQVDEILKKTDQKITHIFLVGGFVLSPYVREFVTEKFGSQCKVVCPADPQEAIMKGAVTFGTKPSVVQSRISQLTYGISECITFNEIKHRGKSSFTNDEGEKFCDVCFHTFVLKDESVGFDEVKSYSFIPVYRDQTAMRFKFYCTESTTARFIDDKEAKMKEIGSFSVPMPDTSGGYDRSVRLEVKFGFTEMQAKAIDLTSGEQNSVEIEFLSSKT